MDVASALNQDVVTDFPVLDAVGKLEPGIYVVTARPWKGAASPADANADESVQLAAQWMVVSDLGLTAISGDDGVHALVQSLGSAGAAGRRRTQARCAQQRGAGVEDDRRRRAGRFRSRSLARQGRFGAGPSGRDARRRLRLSQPRSERLRPQRPRRRWARSAQLGSTHSFTPSAASTARARPCSPTALLRDSKGVAKSGLPLTLVVKRPDGVEYKRATLPDQGLGGRAYAIPLLPGSAAGKWSIDAYADPKGDSIGRVEFMLQDYVPERLDFSLHPSKPIIDPGEPVEFSLDARFLYGAPASGLDVTGAIRLQVGRRRSARRFSWLCRGPRRRRFHHHRESVLREGSDRRQRPC